MEWFDSDKYYWHRFTDDYEYIFDSLSRVQNIMEFGVLNGDSIRGLSLKFPESQIVGVDILEPNDVWPKSDQIRYFREDQENREGLSKIFEQLGVHFQLIIEDGSHEPTHQRNSLFASIPWLSTGGIYILEDIGTSSAELRSSGQISPAFRGNEGEIEQSTFSPIILDKKTNGQLVNCFTLILAIERARKLNRKLINHEKIQLTSTNFFTNEEINEIDESIVDVKLIRRIGLPLQCWKCRSEDFNLAKLLCSCGTKLYQDDDSMSAVLYF